MRGKCLNQSCLHACKIHLLEILIQIDRIISYLSIYIFTFLPFFFHKENKSEKLQIHS